MGGYVYSAERPKMRQTGGQRKEGKMEGTRREEGEEEEKERSGVRRVQGAQLVFSSTSPGDLNKPC